MWEAGVYKPSSRSRGVTSDFAFVVNTCMLNWFAYVLLVFSKFYCCIFFIPKKNFLSIPSAKGVSCYIPKHLRLKNLRFVFVVFIIAVKQSLPQSHIYI